MLMARAKRHALKGADGYHLQEEAALYNTLFIIRMQLITRAYPECGLPHSGL